jgi:hypothetical protein
MTPGWYRVATLVGSSGADNRVVRGGGAVRQRRRGQRDAGDV